MRGTAWRVVRRPSSVALRS